MSDQPERPNPLGKTSLLLGVVALSFVFSVGVCAGIGKEKGWLNVAAAPLLVVGSSCGFVGFLGFVIGIVGLFGRNRPKGAAILGILFGFGAVWLLLAILNALNHNR